jgi:co-chaperonin GroES (HSP10)
LDKTSDSLLKYRSPDLESTMICILVVFSLLATAVSFRCFDNRPRNSLSSLFARVKNIDGLRPVSIPFVVGENIPDEILKQKCIYDMILVERFSQPEKTDFGLFLPKTEGKDAKHLGKVLSVPAAHGLEGEQGRLAPISEIAPYKIGDVVYIKDPWGIGPKDQEVGQRCFSFHKALHITGIVQLDA